MNWYTEEDLKEEMERVSKELFGGEPPRQEQWRNSDTPNISQSTYQKRFGSWNKAKESCGFPVNEYKHKEEYLFQVLKDVSEKFCDGETPRQKDINNYTELSHSTYTRRFGSWNNAVKKAGFEINFTPKISDEELINEFSRVSEKLFNGKTPYVEQWKGSDIPKFSATAYRERFGNWRKACKAAGFKPRYQNEWVLKGPESPTWKGGGELYYGHSWHGQRQKAWERDKFKCRVCNNKEDDMGKKPDVHHIKPVREWDVKNKHKEMNSLENLISLCQSCHNKLEGRWKNASPKQFQEKAEEYLNIQ